MQIMRSEDWFIKIFDQHYDRLKNYLFYLSGDIDWVNDALQDTFLIIWEKRNKIKEETLSAYLYKVARNIFLKQYRHKAVRLKFERQVQIDITEKPAVENILADEFEVHLQQAVSDLPERCRTVFLMSKLDEMTNKQIAGNLDISVKAVEKQMTKAYKLLRGKLSGYQF